MPVTSLAKNPAHPFTTSTAKTAVTVHQATDALPASVVLNSMNAGSSATTVESSSTSSSRHRRAGAVQNFLVIGEIRNAVPSATSRQDSINVEAMDIAVGDPADGSLVMKPVATPAIASKVTGAIAAIPYRIARAHSSAQATVNISGSSGAVISSECAPNNPAAIATASQPPVNSTTMKTAGSHHTAERPGTKPNKITKTLVLPPTTSARIRSGIGRHPITLHPTQEKCAR